MDLDYVNFLLQQEAENLRLQVVDEMYYEMVQAIMAGFYEAFEEGCEFDRCQEATVDQSGQVFA
jgi:hypothetical protein